MSFFKHVYHIFAVCKGIFSDLLSVVRKHLVKVRSFYDNLISLLEKTKYFNKKNRIISLGISFWICHSWLDIEFLDLIQKTTYHLYAKYATEVFVLTLTIWGFRKFIEKLSTVAYFLVPSIFLISSSIGLALAFSCSFGLLLKKMNLSWVYSLPHYHQVTAFFPMWFINLFVFRRILNEYKRLFDWEWLKNHLENLMGRKKEIKKCDR